MASEHLLPANPLEFIRNCVIEKRMLWTYHVTMRMEKRSITRRIVMESANTFEIIEAYPEDKYLPSYLVWAEYEGIIFHVLFATDVADNNVHVVTAYFPNPQKWTPGFKRRK